MHGLHVLEEHDDDDEEEEDEDEYNIHIWFI